MTPRRGATGLQGGARLRRAASLVAALLALPAIATAGTVTGTVTVTPARYAGETVVYLKQVPGHYTPKRATLDQKKLTFVPHVLTITVGDTVDFLNHDAVQHNIFSPDHEGYNLGVFTGGQVRSRQFPNVGVYTQLCAIHAEMLAYIFVGQNPYSAVVDASGHYSIADVPPGTYQLAVWNSHATAPAQNITVGQEPVTVNFTLKK
jgi:plastocyanin